MKSRRVIATPGGSQSNDSQMRILRLPEVKAKTGLSRSTIYARQNSNPSNSSFDPTFPRSISLGGRARGWLAEEVDAWIASRLCAAQSTIEEENRHAV